MTPPRVLLVTLALLPFGLIACVDETTDMPVTPEFAKTPAECAYNAASKAAGDFFLDNAQRRDVRKRLQAMSGGCADGVNVEDLAWFQAQEVETALNLGQAGEPADGNLFLNEVLRLAGLNCPMGASACVGSTDPADIDLSIAMDANGLFGVRGTNTADHADVYSRHLIDNSKWGVQLQAGDTWQEALDVYPAIIYGYPVGMEFQLEVWPAQQFNPPVQEFAKQLRVVACQEDPFYPPAAGAANHDRITKNSNPAAGGAYVSLQPIYGNDVEWCGDLPPAASSASVDASPSWGQRLARLARSLVDLRPARLNATVNPGPRGTGLAGGFSRVRIQNVTLTGELRFLDDPADVNIGQKLGTVRVQALTDDLTQFEPIEFIDVLLGLTANSGNPSALILQTGGPCPASVPDPVPANLLPHDFTLEVDGIATFSDLCIVPFDGNSPNSVAGGYILTATALNDAAFGFDLRDAESTKLNVKP